MFLSKFTSAGDISVISEEFMLSIFSKIALFSLSGDSIVLGIGATKLFLSCVPSDSFGTIVSGFCS